MGLEIVANSCEAFVTSHQSVAFSRGLLILRLYIIADKGGGIETCREAAFRQGDSSENKYEIKYSLI